MDNQVTNQYGHSLPSTNLVLQKTYRLLAWSFLPCILGAVAGMVFNPMAVLGGGWIGIVAVFVFFYGMVFVIEKNRYSNTGVVLLMIFTFGMGILLSGLLRVAGMYSNGAQLVAVAAAMTAGIFFTVSALARNPKFAINTNKLGSFLMAGVVVMIAVIANLFLNLPMLSLTISGVFVFLSSLMIMWKTRVIVEGGEDSYISAALSIFIDIYNLFTSLLRLLLAFTGED